VVPTSSAPPLAYPTLFRSLLSHPKTAPIAHGTLAYEDTGGGGPVVLCLPSLGDLRQEYRFLAPRLVAAGFRVLCADLRGHGDSSAAFPSYDPEDVAADVRAILDHAGVRSAAVIGCSFAAAAGVILAT